MQYNLTSHNIERATELRNQLRESFAEITTLLARNQQFTKIYGLHILQWEHFIWAYTVFDMFSTSVSGISHLMIIPIPSAVIVNSTRLQIEFPAGGDQVVIKSKVLQIPQGTLLSLRELEAVFDNEELVLRVGRVKPANESTYSLVLDIPSEVFDNEIKALIFQFKQLSERHYVSRNRYPAKLLDTLRLCYMSDEEVEQYWEKINAEDDSSEMADEESLELSTSAEPIVMEAARSLVHSVLTVLTEAPAAAEHSHPESNASLCRQYWQCTIDILEGVLQMLEPEK